MGQNNSDYLATAVARNEPGVLDREMTPTDIVEVLKRLNFHWFGQQRTIKIDKDVRDYLLAAIVARRGKISCSP
jgi:hypothetical protein